MQLGFIGLGKMGLNMVTRLIRSGKHDIVVYDPNKEAVTKASIEGAAAASSMEELINKMDKPRAVWLMVPSGNPVDEVIEKMVPHLSEDDVIIDGGNSNYKDSVNRGKNLSERGINFIDVGTSGGIWGLEMGYCMMIGGEKAVFERLRPVLKTLAPPDGYAYMGRVGSGHYVKMIHNAIEYGMLQAYAEGFELLEASGFDLDLGEISSLWNHGSVIRSWLLELTERVFKKNPRLEGIKAYIDDSGEGRWAVFDSIEKNVPCPVITHSLLYRLQSREEQLFAAKVIAALRNEFGGHKIEKGE
ncbi:MAG: phosphogluconate dehydrogenase (NAD(+)-dependent, decarboxylating) [Nitrospirota bacterium]